MITTANAGTTLTISSSMDNYRALEFLCTHGDSDQSQYSTKVIVGKIGTVIDSTWFQISTGSTDGAAAHRYVDFWRTSTTTLQLKAESANIKVIGVIGIKG